MDVLAKKPLVFPDAISDRQFFHGLWKRDLITFEEAIEAVSIGKLPAALLLLIGVLPESQREDTFLLMVGATTYSRTHPSTIVIGQLFGWDADQLDRFWVFAAAL